MKLFTELYLELDRTTRTSEKVAALTHYFRTAPPRDAAWAVFLLSGRKIGKSISWRLMRDWAAEVSGNPIWIVDQSYDLVGDLSETLSLLLPDTGDGSAAPPLHEIVEQRLQVLAKEPRHFGALSGLGLILQDIGDEKHALEAYRKALAVDPHLEHIPEVVKTLTEKVEGRDI